MINSILVSSLLTEENIPNWIKSRKYSLKETEELNFGWFGLCQFQFLKTVCTEGRYRQIPVSYNINVWDMERSDL